MSWLFNNKELTQDKIPEKSIGFLYKITNIKDAHWYIGKKLLTKAATKTINGKKKKIRKESDWIDYYSSSPTLLADIDVEGKDNYRREILLFVFTKAELLVAEEYLLHLSGAMFTDKSYNGNIRSRIQKSWFKKSPTFFDQLKAVKI